MSDSAFNHRASGLNRNNANHVFTSDLSINEFMLVRKSGFEPVGLCMGVSVYHMRTPYTSWSTNEEIIDLTAASYNARHNAIGRMQAEAKQMGADGIVGVRLNIIHRGEHSIEFHAIGTGIVHPDSEKGKQFRDHNDNPFTSDLSGQEFYTLLQSGYRPIEMVMGCCTYHIAHVGMFTAIRRANTNVEMAEFTTGIYTARELAMDRMQQEAINARAEGVIGSRITEHNYYGHDHTREFFAIGTAITSLDGHQTHDIPEPTYVLPLNQ